MAKSVLQSLRLALRRVALRRHGVIIHHDTVFGGVRFLGSALIEPYCRLSGDPHILIGKNFYMNSGCHLLGDITIGDDVMIGPKSVIWGRDHGKELGKLMRSQPHIRAPIVIGNDVWISASVTILKGVTIGSGAVIGAGAVVTRDVPPNAIAVGNPARVVNYRKAHE